MNNLTNANLRRSWFFSDIKQGDMFWISRDPDRKFCIKADFGPINDDGVSRDFFCMIGGWIGTLIECDEGVLKLRVHETEETYLVYLVEKIEQPGNNFNNWGKRF